MSDGRLRASGDSLGMRGKRAGDREHSTAKLDAPGVSQATESCKHQGASWQQIEKVVALSQTIPPSAPGPATGVARCIPIPRRVSLPAASARAQPASLVSVRPAAASSHQWHDAAIVAAGMLLLLIGAGTTAIFTCRRHHRATAS